MASTCGPAGARCYSPPASGNVERCPVHEAAPELLGVVRELVDEMAHEGSSCDDSTLACECFVCRGLRILVALEGPGRCAICGCTEDNACPWPPGGCGWADEGHRFCDRHPPEDIATARLVLAREAEVRRV